MKKKFRTFFNRFTLTLSVLAVFPALGWTQDDDAAAEKPASKNESKSLPQRVKALEDELSALKTSNAEMNKQAHEEKLRLHFNLYGDAEYRVTGSSSSFPQQNGFFVGQTDLHIMAQYGEHLSAMSEDVVEFDGEEPSIDLERIVVFYTFSDQFRLGAGRDHTAFSYWNRTFHHGAQLQTTIDRPFFLKFEDGGGVVPAHIVGLFAYGNFDIGSSQLKYEFNVGNNGLITLNGDGSGTPTDAFINFNPEGDTYNAKRLAARLVFKPVADGGLALGIASVLSHYGVESDDPAIAAGPMVFGDLAQILLEGEVIYTDSNFEFMSEFYQFNDNTGLTSFNGSSNNTAFYVQAAFQDGDFKPYVRVENLTVDGGDPYFQALLKTNKSIFLAGLRYELVPIASSLKLEVRAVNESGAASTELDSAWGFQF